MQAERTKTREERRKKAGFTLIEVLLVVAILGILAAVAVKNLGGRREMAMVGATRASIAAIAGAIDLYEVDTGRYPSSLQGLLTSDGAPNWSGPYLKGGEIPVDGWGRAFAYSLDGKVYKIASAGPDTQSGTGDDITN
jgi:general secretion pathway protein G